MPRIHAVPRPREGRTRFTPSDIALRDYSGFPGGAGTPGEPGAFEELLGDVSSQLFGFYGDGTVVNPQQGDDTNLGAERSQLAEWRERGW
jgi:hypothetical protein